MRKLLLVAICCFVLGGCASYEQPQTITSVTEEPEATSTPRPTKTQQPILKEESEPTKEPTNTPIPTSTQVPTSTPTPTPLPTNTPTPKPTAIPKPTATLKPTDIPKESEQDDEIIVDISIEPTLLYSFEGKGDDVITDVYIEKGKYVKFICMDEGHKSLKVYFEDDWDLLVNSTEPYEGTTFLHIKYDTDVMFEINADEEWVLEIYDFGFCTKDDFSGTGDYVSPLFIPTSNVYEINSEFDGHFAVKGYYGDFEYDLLVNETDPYSGKVLFKPKEEVTFFVVTADGEWSIKPVK